MAKAKEVAPISELYPTERPDFMGDKARGNEDVSAADLTIPRIDIIQDLSPQHKPNKAEYIEGAAVGMIFNTATNALYGDRIHIVPVYFRKEYIIWKDQKAGGGFKGAFRTMTEAEAELTGLEDAAQCEIVDTAQQFCLLVHPDSTAEAPILEQAVMSMSKSKMKPNRQLNTMIAASGGDRFERMYEAQVVEAQNAAGQDYFNWKVIQRGFVNQLIFEAAEKFYDTIKSGALDVSRRPESTGNSGPDRGSEEMTDEEEF